MNDGHADEDGRGGVRMGERDGGSKAPASRSLRGLDGLKVKRLLMAVSGLLVAVGCLIIVFFPKLAPFSTVYPLGSLFFF